MLYVIIALFAVGLDQLYKAHIENTVALGAAAPFIPGFLRLTNVRNTGAAFSLFQNMRPLLLVLTTAFCLAAVAALVLRRIENKAGLLGLAFLLGGAAGNLIDRIRCGFVTDMFEFEFVRFAIFNIADCFITVGGIIFCIYIIKSNFAQNPEREVIDDADTPSIDS